MSNVLIIGFGSIAKKHLTALHCSSETFHVYALRSDPDAAEDAEVKNVFDLSVLNIPIDFAIISNPTSLHEHYINELAVRKIPMFIEKPPISSLKNADLLVQKVKDATVINYVACNLRFHPCIQFVKDFMTAHPETRVNEVNVYCGSYLPDWRPILNYREVYSANAEMGGGVHLDLFHELDYVHWIFGKPLEVYCTKQSSSSLDINAVDYANYILTYSGFTTSIILNYYRKNPKRTMEILFEDETWFIDLLDNSITNDNGFTVFKDGEFRMSDTYQTQMLYFVQCLKENKMPMNCLEEALETLKTCLYV
jgi:predicted dehydrogenase